ncbi:MAG: hypothetical protein ABJO14_01105 [Haloferula sp.]
MRGRSDRSAETSDAEGSRSSEGSDFSPTAALRLGDPVVSAQAFSHAIQRLENADEFKAVFDELLPDLEKLASHDALFLLADAWAAKAPEEAAAWLDALDFNDSRNPYLFSALSQWSSSDPAAAMAWLQTHHGEAGPSRGYLVASLVRGSALRDPEFALEVLLNAPDGPERVGSVEFLTRAWSNEGFESALANLEKLPGAEDHLRKRAIQQLVTHADPEDLESVKSWAIGMTSEAERQTAIAAFAARWSRKDPEEATEWADGLDDPASRSIAYGEIATRWARVDPLAAGEWLAPHAGDGEHDLAARAVAWSTVGIDPDTAFAQVDGISNAGLREESFEQVARMWMSENAQQAREYFEGDNPIPPAIRERLLESYE